MQDDEFECIYDDFEIIRLDPNMDYVDSSEEDDCPMDCSTAVSASKEIKIVKEVSTLEMESNCCDNNVQEKKHEEEEEMSVECSKPRKKLNLEEYKIRRANKPAPSIGAESKNKNILELCENIPETLPPIVLPTDPRSFKNLLTNQTSSAGENQEISNEIEQQDVSRATEIMPEIHPDYEEIVVISMACNTEISISPRAVDVDSEKSSTNLLTNIVNSFQQQNNNSAKSILNSSTSLLSSINAVLLSENRPADESIKTKKSQSDEHGENKVIMHLRKDRVRPFRSSCEIQTDVTPLFPPLILSPSLIFNRIKNARNFRRRSTRSRSRSRSTSPEPEYHHHHRRGNYKYSRSVNSSSMNSSDSSDSDTSTYSSCRSSDSIKRFDNRYKHGYQRPNFFQEERKIIYIGGLLEETTKDELRRKFLKYGTIKKISLHVKEDGSLRYGFVTFAEANAAYDVLDGFNKDPALCNFDLRFGGRRKFCRQTYADLDSCNQENEDIYNNNNSSSTAKSKPTELSFEDLLNMTKRKLCKN